MATMTPQDSWYWVRWRNQLAVFVNMLEDRPRQSRREIERIREGTRTSGIALVREQAAWSAVMRVQFHLEEVARDVSDALRTLTNMICLTERLTEEQDTHRLTASPPIARVPQERSWLTLNQYHRDSAGPETCPAEGMGAPAPGTRPLLDGERITDTGHPMPLEHAERPVETPRVVRRYGQSSALG